MNPTVLISLALDDVPMSPDAFRVYFHLVNLKRLYGKIKITYREIGSHCFPDCQSLSARTKAVKVVKELRSLNLIQVQRSINDQGIEPNQYFLTEESEWHQGGAA